MDLSSTQPCHNKAVFPSSRLGTGKRKERNGGICDNNNKQDSPKRGLITQTKMLPAGYPNIFKSKM